MISSGGKTKFKVSYITNMMIIQHWFYDLGFRTAIAVTLFTFCLFFSIIIPHLMPLATLLFFLAVRNHSFIKDLQYCLDKYNLIYVYPLDFDSRPTQRKALIIYSIVGIILFQLGMFIVAGTVISKRISIYLFAFLVIQAMILFTTFEFIRKPWDGRELEVEKALQ